MSLNTMAQRMILEIPGLSSPYARTLLNEALGLIEDAQLWSFQLKTGSWLTPGLLFPGGPGTSVGTVSVTAYSDQVVPSTAAKTAWLAYTGQPFFTQLQFRSPFYSLYNIIAINPATGVVTLDRPWMEPTMVAATYMIYGAYFAAPVPDFKRFLSARDTTNNYKMDYWSLSQKDLSVRDPERVEFDDPIYIVPFEQDQRPNSATFGNFLYELWPQPLSVLPYTFQYLRRGPQLVQPGDTVPYPFSEEMVLWRAKETAYLWKEAQRGEEIQRGSGADWKFLAEAAGEEYKKTAKPIKDKDQGLVELYFSRWNPEFENYGEPYMNQVGGLNVGRM